MSKVKKVVKKVVNVVSKVASSTVGKIALAGLAIYTGGAALGAWGSAAASASAAASSGGFLSAGGIAGKIARAAFQLSTLGGVIGTKAEDYSQPLAAQGGTVPSEGANLTAEAAAAAAEEEKKRQRRGAGQNIATSPLGLVTPGQNAASVLLG